MCVAGLGVVISGLARPWSENQTSTMTVTIVFSRLIWEPSSLKPDGDDEDDDGERHLVAKRA